MSSLATPRFQPRVDCFSVSAAADPSALPRILEVFSLFGVIPCRCHSARVETDPDQLVVDIQVADLPHGRAQQMAKRLERVITVTQVLHSERRAARWPEACGRGAFVAKIAS